ncbi:MAG: HAMP domain-containing histidine kinase [Bdellovibrionales bacterium]|nr:HAMP domain-containing histidine kinase [Bdellovibrionales bacterium]
MSIAYNILKRIVQLSAFWSMAGMVLIYFAMVSTYANINSNTSIKNINKSVSQAASAYRMGDLFSFQRNLSSIAQSYKLENASFVSNNDPNPMWMESYGEQVSTSIIDELDFLIIKLTSPLDKYWELNFSLPVYFNGPNSDIIGHFSASLSLMKEWQQQRKVFLIFFTGFFAFWLCYLLFSWHSVNRLTKPLQELKNSLKQEASKIDLSLSDPGDRDEIQTVQLWFNQLTSSWLEAQTRKIEISRLNALTELSAQVAHDIKSPLSALSVLSKTIKADEESQSLVRSICTRITDIVNDLDHVRQNRSQPKNCNSRKPKVESVTTNSDIELLPLKDLVQQVVNEKRVNFPNCNFIFLYPDSKIRTSALVSGSDFRRVISNIVNNALEASNDKALVKIEIKKDSDDIKIEISDSGCGIPLEKLNEILKKGESYNKPSGSGLGLWHANEKIKSWLGDLNISSKEGVGTTVTLLLPSPLKYFASLRGLGPDSKIVVYQPKGGLSSGSLPKNLSWAPFPISFLTTYEELKKVTSLNSSLNTLFVLDLNSGTLSNKFDFVPPNSSVVLSKGLFGPDQWEKFDRIFPYTLEEVL